VISCDREVCGAPFDHAQHGRKDAADGSNFSSILITRGGQGVIMPEQLVRAVDQIDIHAFDSRQPYRAGGR
jgi:hypothetical protein